MLSERDALRTQIAEETKKRDAFLDEKRREQAAASGKEDFESALRTAVRKQAEKKGFNFK